MYGNSGVSQACRGGGCLGHLHQGKHTLILPGAARCRHHQQRYTPVVSKLEQPRNALTGGPAHAAGDKPKLHHPHRHLVALDATDPAHDSLGATGGGLGFGDSVWVTTARAGESERIGRHHVRCQFSKTRGVV